MADLPDAGADLSTAKRLAGQSSETRRGATTGGVLVRQYELLISTTSHQAWNDNDRMPGQNNILITEIVAATPTRGHRHVRRHRRLCAAGTRPHRGQLRQRRRQHLT